MGRPFAYSFLGICLLLSLGGCKFTGHRWEMSFSEHDYYVLKPVFANTFVKLKVLNIACTEVGKAATCVFTPGVNFSSAGLYHRLLKGDGHRTTILDSKVVPLATALRYEFDAEDLVDNKFVTQDGRMTIEVGSMLGGRELTAEELCGRPKCCKPPFVAQFEHIAIVTILPEAVVPPKN